MKLLTVFLVYLAAHACSGARILFMGAIGTVSHKRFYMPIAEGLAERGHNVTVVSPFTPKGKPIENIREIVVDDMIESASVDYFYMRKFRGILLLVAKHWIIGEVELDAYEKLMRNQKFRQLQRDEKFDLIVADVIFNEFSLPIIDSWQVPIVGVSPTHGHALNTLGSPRQIASFPSLWTDYNDQMSYSQRFIHTIGTIVALLTRDLFILNPLNSKIRKDFPEMRTIQEIEKDISLCLINSNPSYSWPRPFPPYIIEVNAMYIEHRKPLSSVTHRHLILKTIKHSFKLFVNNGTS